MKKNNFKALALSLPLLGSVLASPATFAVVNDHDIKYTGGENLSDEYLEEIPDILNNLTQLVKNPTTTFSDAWGTAYYKSNDTSCKLTHFVRVNQNSQKDENSGLSFTLNGTDGYSLEINVKGIQTDSATDVAVGVIDDTSAIHAGEPLYQTDQCTTYEVQDNQLLVKDEKRVFVDMVATLKKGEKVFKHEGIYFGITDIDAAQSYKIVGDSEFDKTKMFTPSLDKMNQMHVEPTPDPEGSVTLENRFVTDGAHGNYIYSQYYVKREQGSDPIGYALQNNNGDKAVVFSPIKKEDISNLNFIFGFAKGAGSQIRLYVKQYNIKYTSDDNGKISDDGIKEESILIDENPSGTETEPDKGYELSYWVADKDVIDENGETIEAGTPISDEELTTVTLNEDTEFTAIHEKAPAVPDTGGSISEEFSGAVVPMSIAGVITLAIILFYLPRINHKKVNFKK